jgi:DNA mismatch repair protein MSH5
VIDVKNGRHPLQELCVDSFVPNDTSLNMENGIVHILTGSSVMKCCLSCQLYFHKPWYIFSVIGPNASGKSVYLKQVALISYLAHIGSFVPAERATVCLLDHIHSRIQTVESVATQMSSFVLDLKQVRLRFYSVGRDRTSWPSTHSLMFQMSLSLYNSTPNSLVVIDEFGKGTTEIDGLSLLTASLTSFINRGENCPFIIVSTHFRKLPTLLPDSPLVKHQVSRPRTCTQFRTHN